MLSSIKFILLSLIKLLNVLFLYIASILLVPIFLYHIEYGYCLIYSSYVILSDAPVGLPIAVLSLIIVFGSIFI